MGSQCGVGESERVRLRSGCRLLMSVFRFWTSEAKNGHEQPVA